ncbi:PhzF family phenazine biosynthesis protein [Streptomyces sp. NPDC002308]
MSTPRVTLVHACLRDGSGGSPTAVVLEGDGGGPAPGDDERRRIPAARGTSHAVYVRHSGDVVDLRFFTAQGELPACGHGTIAALALLAVRHGGDEPYRVTLRAAGRVFAGRAVRDGDLVTAAFDPGPVSLREPVAEERTLVLAALGVAPDEAGPDVRIAGAGSARVLVPVPSRTALAELRPDLARLRTVCDRLGLIGAYVYSPPSPEGALGARMFAPSIGVGEDLANANGTAALAAHLAGRGVRRIAVDMGDALGGRATVTATAGPGPGLELGGTARVLTDQNHRNSIDRKVATWPSAA